MNAPAMSAHPFAAAVAAFESAVPAEYSEQQAGEAIATMFRNLFGGTSDEDVERIMAATATLIRRSRAKRQGAEARVLQ